MSERQQLLPEHVEQFILTETALGRPVLLAPAGDKRLELFSPHEDAEGYIQIDTTAESPEEQVNWMVSILQPYAPAGALELVRLTAMTAHQEGTPFCILLMQSKIGVLGEKP